MLEFSNFILSRLFQIFDLFYRKVVLVLHEFCYNHEINAEMYFVRVFYSSMKILLFAIFLGKCFGSFQINEQQTSAGDEKMKDEYTELLLKSINESYEEPDKFSVGKNPFTYRRQDFNESLEKIQMMNDGMVMKSAFIPLVQSELNVKLNEKYCKNESTRTTETPASASPLKENIIMKNGKKYKIIKVKKNTKSINENAPKNQFQRRTFKPIPNLLSILPLKWMTRQQKNETQTKTRFENVYQWSKLVPVENPEENSKETFQHGGQSSEKIKKLINLFTIVKFENGECYANGIKGTCLHQMECEAKGGKFAATCAEDLGVCCYSEKTCGETSKDQNTYFINEGFPDTSTAAPKVCTLTLEKTNPDVKQLRMDFQIFQLREPTNGTCLHDRLVISGQDVKDVVPEICGINSGQHIYVDIEDSNGPFNLNVVTVGEYFPRNFRIKVTQLKKEDALLAPKNCLQYHSEPVGYVQTFNYQQDINENLDEVVNGYFNNLNYAICIKKQKGFCSISYENEEVDTRQPTFQLVNVDEDGERLLPPRQAGAETFDCPDDYIVINGIRLCGEKLNDASVEVDYTRNYPVTDTTNGPFILSVRTDATVSGRGFHLKYMQNPCPT